MASIPPESEAKPSAHLSKMLSAALAELHNGTFPAESSAAISAKKNLGCEESPANPETQNANQN
jgi:hypothetical protein